MKQAYIIYHADEGQKNKSFIQMFQKAGEKQGISFTYHAMEEQLQPDRPLPDMVLNRTRSAKVSRWYQERGVAALHDAWFVTHANDKYKMLAYYRDHLPREIRQKKWCPDTVYLPAGTWTDEQEMRRRIKEGEWRVGNPEYDRLRQGVIKTVDGHGGAEVFLVQDPAWRRQIVGERDCVLQERISCGSKDIRVYVLGRTIYCAVQRTGAQKDAEFRSNYSLGGDVQEITLPAPQRQFVQAFIDSLPKVCYGLFGVDFFPLPDGTLLFNEVEEMVGCRMLYQCTTHDVVADYVALLQNNA